MSTPNKTTFRIAALISGGGTTLRNLFEKIRAGRLDVEVALVEAQQSELLVISRRRILPDGRFHLTHATSAFQEAECAGIEELGEPLNGEIDQRAQRPQEDDEVEPIKTGWRRT